MIFPQLYPCSREDRCCVDLPPRYVQIFSFSVIIILTHLVHTPSHLLILILILTRTYTGTGRSRSMETPSTPWGRTSWDPVPHIPGPKGHLHEDNQLLSYDDPTVRAENDAADTNSSLNDSYPILRDSRNGEEMI